MIGSSNTTSVALSLSASSFVLNEHLKEVKGEEQKNSFGPQIENNDIDEINYSFISSFLNEEDPKFIYFY